jgi:hypothetical protein
MPDEPPFDEPPFNAEAIAAALAQVAAAQGDAASVAALAVSIPRLEKTGYDGWDDGTDLLTLYLEVPIPAFGQLFRVREDAQNRMLPVLKTIIDAYRHFRAIEVCIVPVEKAPSNWREHAIAWLRGEGVTNHSRFAHFSGGL